MLKVEIAETPSALQKGLMFRKHIPDDAGMLFIFNSPQHLSFWGRNTYVPLDIAFVNPQGEIDRISHISPLSDKFVTSESECSMAVEANLGYFAGKDIKPGDKINIDRLSDKIAVISF